jgi:signal transduction histidine kinase
MSIRVARPAPQDALIAAGLMTAALTEVWVTRSAPGPAGTGTVVALLSTVPLSWRRSQPELGVVLAVVAIVLPAALDPATETDGLVDLVAWLVAVHALNAYRGRAVSLAGTAAVIAGLTAVVLAASDTHAAVNVAWGAALVLAAAAAGRLLRTVEGRHEAEREAAEELARAAERRRIARELHDVVAHGLALMVVQAGAAQELVATQPRRAVELLDGVQTAGTGAASELRRLLGLLGDPEPGPASGQQLTDLPELVAKVQRAGLPVSLETAEVPDLPADIQRAVFRVVQEGLTNALKHGAREEVVVSLCVDGAGVAVEVADLGGVAGRPDTGGRGLSGLRERVAFHGGTLTVSDDDSAWRIRAVLPAPGQGAAS